MAFHVEQTQQWYRIFRKVWQQRIDFDFHGFSSDGMAVLDKRWCAPGMGFGVNLHMDCGSSPTSSSLSFLLLFFL